MDIQQQWPVVRKICAGYTDFVIASNNDDGSPHITPIGSIILRDDCTGYYLEKFPTGLRHNIARDSRICGSNGPGATSSCGPR